MNMLKKWSLIFLLPTLLIACGTSTDEAIQGNENQETEGTKEKELPEFSATELFQLYAEKSADTSKVDHEFIIVHGKVKHADPDKMFGRITIHTTLEVEDSPIDLVICHIDVPKGEEAPTIKEGDQIRLKGFCTGQDFLGNVSLTLGSYLGNK
ncbi:MAG: hypothetical protein EP338_01595 [Bacteroidetes bacterium]|nr:MAG: hypothetical protein EP338_01595 [Bacteroidota bacterium]